ncbi:MAG: hypothetical protein A3F74_24425 [Betaproteobacteria bacterium RIFCSPLOWO2_12_FULL_62_58]|nr:MAG: hypothetical protein A3F74_24425 [Betaproteobacteria bacterium RIFCSPLOWO2_12_FULL_62_58]
MKQYKFIKTTSRLALAAVLFAQVALVANACLRLDTGPQAAFAASQMADCDMCTTANPNLCLFQYLDQSDQTQPSVAPAPVNVAVLAAPVAPAQASATAFTHARFNSLTGPPIIIRNCCLRI